jgi:hypothetical protein
MNQFQDNSLVTGQHIHHLLIARIVRQKRVFSGIGIGIIYTLDYAAHVLEEF